MADERIAAIRAVLAAMPASVGGADTARSLLEALDALASRLAAHERVADAAREALAAWSRMPDAGFTDSDPRWAWWHYTTLDRDALRAALAGLDGQEEPRP